MDPSNVVYVGNMPVDEQVSRKAGLDCLHAGKGYGERSKDPIRVDKPEAILNLVS